MKHLSIDIETFSSVDIKKAGLYRYAQSPDFQILLFAYSYDGGPVQLVDLAQGEVLPDQLLHDLQDPNVIKHAYNAAFEWYCLNQYLNPYNWITPLPQWRCTQLHGLYCGYPLGLGNINTALGVSADKHKMSIGRNLIRLFSCPTKPTAKNGQRTRTLPHHEPEKWELYKEYCRQDVVAEMEVERRLSSFPVPEMEQRLWEFDVRMNAIGVAVDLELVQGALAVDEVSAAELMAEAKEITGLDNPKSVAQLSKWLCEEIGEEVENLQKATVKDMLKGLDDGAAKQMLELRQELSKTSVKKYAAMDVSACDDSRIRGIMLFYGANRTGRWAGRIVQPQNLPKNHIETLDLARGLLKGKKADAMRLIYGNVPDTLAQLIRTAFVPKEGCVFLVADFSAIEARVLSWLASEQWRLDVFSTHGKIYEASASQMFGVPLEKITKGNPEYELRAKGKIAELALGYGGSVGAMVNMGADKMGLEENDMKEIIRRWRSSNRRICDFWYACENAALSALQTGRPAAVDKGIVFAHEADPSNGLDFLTIRLPNGRKLYYVNPFLAVNEKGREAIHYWGIHQKTGKWCVLSTYYGKIVENITQAVARDCLAETLLRVQEAGYQTVFHVHDEVIVEAPEGTQLQPLLDIMSTPIPWAPGLLLKGAGFSCDYYQKD